MKNDSFGVLLLRFLLMFFVGIGIAFMLTYHIPRKYVSPKQCAINMNILLGAIEMYNMDHENTITSITPKDYLSKDGRLIKNKYLFKPLELQSPKCVYTYNPHNKEKIRCKIHGTPDHFHIPTH